METGEPSPCLQKRMKGYKIMKRKYRLISVVCGFVLLIGILVFGISQWNQDITKTTEQAKDDLNMAEQAKVDPNVNGDDSKDAVPSTSKKNNPDSDSEQSDPTQSGSVELDPSTVPKIDSKEQNESANAHGNETSGSQGVDVKLPSHSSHTLPEIKTAYRDAFSDLEVQQTSRMDQLLVQAKADYVSGKLSKADLAVRYQDTATTLERNTDQLFNALYQQMQTDLEKNGHSANEAIEFRNEYQAKKQERLTHVISQIQNF